MVSKNKKDKEILLEIRLRRIESLIFFLVSNHEVKSNGLANHVRTAPPYSKPAHPEMATIKESAHMFSVQ